MPTTHRYIDLPTRYPSVLSCHETTWGQRQLMTALLFRRIHNIQCNYKSYERSCTHMIKLYVLKWIQDSLLLRTDTNEIMIKASDKLPCLHQNNWFTLIHLCGQFLKPKMLGIRLQQRTTSLCQRQRNLFQLSKLITIH